MARNLTRNTKLYISNQGTIGSCTSANTWEVKILDGYSFSQPTTTEDITIDEAGSTPIRGQKTFNIAQEPVDVSLGTYIRPYDNNASIIDAPERILWLSLSSRLATVLNANGDNVDTTAGNGSGIEQRASGTGDSTSDGMRVDFEESDSNELGKLTMWFHLENSTYRVDNVNISTAEIDFAIDGIAMINWTGQGTTLTELPATGSGSHATIAAWVAGVGGTDDYRAVPATTSDSFLRNKLSTMTLVNTQTSSVKHYSSQVATGGSTTTLTDTGELFITDALIANGDYIVNETTTETAVIQSFTEDTITIEGTWTAPTTDTYSIIDSTLDAAQSYTIAITGGNLTVENNMSFLTPEELGVVNQPLPGFAGSRAINGTVTAYLDTGFYGTAALLQDALDAINSVTNSYNFTLHIGGISTAVKRVEIQMPTAQISVPTVNVEDVIATEITFAGQGSGGLLENQDELLVTYHSD